MENLVRFGGLRPDRNDVIQIDPPHAYGIVQYAIDIWGGLKRLQVSPKPADIITNAYLAP